MKAASLISTGLFIAGTAAFSFQDREVASATGTMQDTVQFASPPANTSSVEPDGANVLETWVRPDGPVRVALQAGHWKAAEAPDEQAGLRTNGTRGGGKAEWQVNLEIATLTAEILTAQGFEVEILPTTVPPGYLADLFVSIHADGNNNTSVSGYRAAAPRRDQTGRAAEFVSLLERSYGESTGLRHYPTVTRRMTGYYAFNYRRYEHALHPMTVGVILETGFLTSPSDRRIIVDGQDRAARGIAAAISEFLAPVRAEVERSGGGEVARAEVRAPE